MAGNRFQTQSASPLYAQMMDQIRKDIQRGVYPVGEKIPTEHELESGYGVSRVTVRRALQELTNAGLLERKQGKGTFVARPKAEIRNREIRSFHDSCREQGMAPSVGAVQFQEVTAGEEDRRRLGLPEDASVLEIRRVLLADREPVILEKLHFSMAFAWLENADLRGSLYRAMQEYGMLPENSIYDLFLKRAGKEEAEILRIPEGMVILAENQVVYDQKGRPLHTAERLIQGEKYTLRI